MSTLCERVVVTVVAAVIALSAVQASAQSQSVPVQPGASPAAAIGVFAYPRNSQTAEQQADDENACYASAKQQTGIDPKAPAPAPQPAASQKGGGAKGAGRGAAGGAAVGAITGDAGSGAAVGATVGAVRGRRQQRKANKEAERQAGQQSQAQQQQSLDTFRRAFSACMDSRGYSVK